MKSHLSAQAAQAVAITYHSQAFLAISEAMPPFPDTAGLDAEDLKEVMEEYELLKAFALKQVTETNELRDTSIYTIYQGRVRTDRTSYQLSDDEFRLSNLSEGKHYHYYTLKGEPKLTWSWLHDEEKQWEVTYQVDTFPGDRKEILGYDCYRMTISEHRTLAAEGYDERQEYDVYVTAELPLPFRVVGVFWRPVTELCALEIIYRDPKHPKSYAKIMATDVRTDISPEVLEVPDQYRGLKK